MAWSLLPFEDKNLLKNEAKNIIKKLEKEHKIKPSIVINKVTSNDELKKSLLSKQRPIFYSPGNRLLQRSKK